MGSKPLRIRFDKTDGFIKIYDWIRISIIFDNKQYDVIHNRIRYRMGEKSGITVIINSNLQEPELIH